MLTATLVLARAPCTPQHSMGARRDGAGQTLGFRSLHDTDAAPPQALANTLWALVTMGRPPPPVWLAAFLSELQLRLDGGGAPPQHPPSAPSSASGGRSGEEDGDLGGPSAAAAAAPGAAEGALCPLDVSSVLWSLARLGVRPPLGVLGPALELLYGGFGQLSPQGLANAAAALAELGVRPSAEWVEVIAGAFGGVAAWGWYEFTLALVELGGAPKI